MKAMKIYVHIFMMLAAFSLASCSSESEDGDWDPMVWKAEVAVQTTDGICNVPETGGEFTFSCRNYSAPWMEWAESNGVYYYPPRDKNDYHTITGDWFKAEMNGNRLTVVFEGNDTNAERMLQLTVTAGDIFYTFVFKQKPEPTQALPKGGMFE